uniref:Uncharacterized protein n=1 Tax=Ciona intestinalis TaxID=7719 RepID=H2XL88_CIOIN
MMSSKVFNSLKRTTFGVTNRIVFWLLHVFLSPNSMVIL